MQLANIMVTIGAMAIIGGISIILGDIDNKDTGSIMGFIGLAVCLAGYVKAMHDDQKELEKQRKQMDKTEEMSANIKAMSNNIGNLVEEIRKDRTQRKIE